jgi:hypothetical protein
VTIPRTTTKDRGTKVNLLISTSFLNNNFQCGDFFYRSSIKFFEDINIERASGEMDYPQRLRIGIFIDLSNMTSLLNVLARYGRYLSYKLFD